MREKKKGKKIRTGRLEEREIGKSIGGKELVCPRGHA